MSDPLRDEFISSFENYVPEDGNDVRSRMLEKMLEVPVGQLIGQQMLEPHDLAALMTSAVLIDPRSPQARRLMSAYQAWRIERQEVEDAYEDPDMVTFEPQVEDIRILVDRTVEGLDNFFEAAPTTPGGKAYVAQILVCLMWAYRIPKMSFNLWSPKEGQE